MKQATIIATLVVLLAKPSTLLAADRSLMEEVWSRICGMVDVWEVACDFKRMETALQDYQRDTGKSLSPGAGLDTLVDQGYLASDDIEDPWGNTYRYRVSLDGQGGYLTYLSSAGPDGVHGTDDDLGNSFTTTGSPAARHLYSLEPCRPSRAGCGTGFRYSHIPVLALRETMVANKGVELPESQWSFTWVSAYQPRLARSLLSSTWRILSCSASSSVNFENIYAPIV